MLGSYERSIAQGSSMNRSLSPHHARHRMAALTAASVLAEPVPDAGGDRRSGSSDSGSDRRSLGSLPPGTRDALPPGEEGRALGGFTSAAVAVRRGRRS